jgi:hypothetical protein
MRLDLDMNDKKIKEIADRLEGYDNRFAAESDLIQDMANKVRKCEDLVKGKADGDEIDSLSTLVHELYERLVVVEKRGIAGSFAESGVTSPVNDMAQPRLSSISTMRSAPRDQKQLKEL